MQVACSQCGARYEFEASAIPPGGYDAQCTSCGNVFFVSPESSAPAAADPDALVTVTCTNCQAVYQFAASAIPAGGYDAQCTQCQAVFFVSPQGGAAPSAAAPAAPAAIPEEPTGPSTPPLDAAAIAASVAAEGEPPLESLEPLEAEPMAVEAIGAEPEAPAAAMADAGPYATPDPAPAPAPESFEQGGEPVDSFSPAEAAVGEPPLSGTESTSETSANADLVALGASLGDPESAQVDAGNEFEGIMRKKRRRITIALAALGVIVVAVVGMYFVAPRAFDVTIGKYIGVKRTVDPRAIPLCERAQKRLLDDTDAAYTEALTALGSALEIDPDYPDAIAYAALVHVFRATDLQVAGREEFDRGTKAAAELKALEEAKAPIPQAATRKDALRREISTRGAASTQLFERAGKDMSEALALLSRGQKRHRDLPLMAEVAGLYYATDPDAQAKAGELLRVAVERRLGAGATMNLAKPPSAIAAYLQARLWQSSTGNKDRAREALEAALRLEPRFERVRFELARDLLHAGKTQEARSLLGEIIKSTDSPKAKALLATLDAPVPTQVAKADPEPVEAPKTQVQKGKKRKGKARRR